MSVEYVLEPGKHISKDSDPVRGSLSPGLPTVCSENTYLLFVALVEMVTAVKERVATHDPLLLDEALEPSPGSTVGIHHHLHQRGEEAAEVRSVLFYKGPAVAPRRRRTVLKGQCSHPHTANGVPKSKGTPVVTSYRRGLVGKTDYLWLVRTGPST